MRTKEEIIKEIKKLDDIIVGYSYEDGIRDALFWVIEKQDILDNRANLMET
jgi:hypothetical protein